MNRREDSIKSEATQVAGECIAVRLCMLHKASTLRRRKEIASADRGLEGLVLTTALTGAETFFWPVSLYIQHAKEESS